jgi:ABC-type branched-subunit amino acid transport system ATPase component
MTTNTTTDSDRERETAMLEIKNLHASVEGNEILKGIDLVLKAGEVHAIMGPNGSGKSTLARVLAGQEAYAVTGGEVRFEGKDLLEMAPEERARPGWGTPTSSRRRSTPCASTAASRRSRPSSSSSWRAPR